MIKTHHSDRLGLVRFPRNRSVFGPSRPRQPSLSAPLPHRYPSVVPLINYERYYGGVTVRIGSGEGVGMRCGSGAEAGNRENKARRGRETVPKPGCPSPRLPTGYPYWGGKHSANPLQPWDYWSNVAKRLGLRQSSAAFRASPAVRKRQMTAAVQDASRHSVASFRRVCQRLIWAATLRYRVNPSTTAACRCAKGFGPGPHSRCHAVRACPAHTISCAQPTPCKFWVMRSLRDPLEALSKHHAYLTSPTNHAQATPNPGSTSPPVSP